jgi:hypothetical protein
VNGTVVRWGRNEDGFSSGIIAEDVTDCWFHVRPRAVEQDSLGRAFLVEGEPVNFDEGTDHVTGNGKVIKQAANVRRFFKETADYRTRREYCEVADFQFVARMLGGKLFIDRHTAPKHLRVGQVIRCEVRPPLKGEGTWCTANIEIIADDAGTFDWSSVPLEGEVIPSGATSISNCVVEAEKSILFTDRFRGTKLRNIGIKRTAA